MKIRIERIERESKDMWKRNIEIGRGERDKNMKKEKESRKGDAVRKEEI